MSMRAARFALALAVATPLALVEASAHAQQPATSSSENRALAETLFFTGRGMMEAGRYADAALKLAESYRLDPAPGTLLNLAVCHQKIDKIASAWGEFRQALADAKRTGRADREELALKALAEIEPDLPYMSIEVPAGVRVPGLTITRNSVPLSAATLATELPVDPGDVEIVSRAPGYKPKTQIVKIEKKQHLTVKIEKLDIAPAEIRPQDWWTTRRRIGATMGVVGFLSVGVGAFLGIRAISKRKESDDACPVFDGERRCSQAGVSAMSDARTASWISDVGFGFGALAIAGGALLLFTGGTHRESPPQTAANPLKWNVWFDVAGNRAQGFVGSTF